MRALDPPNIANTSIFINNDKESLFWPRKKPLREWGHSRTVFLMHRDPSEALFWSQKSPVGWSSDSESRGTEFDSRLVQVILGALFGHVGVTFSSFLGHVGACLGMLWGCFRMGLAGFRRKVPRGSKKLEKNYDFQK